MLICQQIEPAQISHIDFRRPKRGKENEESSTSIVVPNLKCPRLSRTEEEDFFTKLRVIQPDSAILSMVYENSQASSEPETRIVRKLPTPLTDLMDEK